MPTLNDDREDRGSQGKPQPSGADPSPSQPEQADVRTLRRRVHFILEVDRFGDRMSRIVDVGLVALIIANVLVSIIQTVDGIYQAAPWAFEWFEVISIVVFGLEYLLRVWSSVEAAAFQGRFRGRFWFALQPMMVLDLAVLILPVYFDLRPLRILRLLRLGRYSPRLRLFGRVLAEKRDELFVGLFVAVVMLVACSTAMYHLEGSVNENFQSIPETMWWGVATLTTVGYGDVYPVTGAGKILGAMVALLGIGVFALPAGILASGFSEALERDRALRAARIADSEGPGMSPIHAVAEAHFHAAEAQCAAIGAVGALGDAAGTVPNIAVSGSESDGQTGGTCPHCGASL